MSCAFCERVNVDTTISTSRLHNPSAATGHVLNLTSASARHDDSVKSNQSSRCTHPVKWGAPDANGRVGAAPQPFYPRNFAPSPIDRMGVAAARVVYYRP